MEARASRKLTVPLRGAVVPCSGRAGSCRTDLPYRPAIWNSRPDTGADGRTYVPMWDLPFCRDLLHLPPTADVDKNDLLDMTVLWPASTDPEGPGWPTGRVDRLVRATDLQ